MTKRMARLSLRRWLRKREKKLKRRKRRSWWNKRRCLKWKSSNRQNGRLQMVLDLSRLNAWLRYRLQTSRIKTDHWSNSRLSAQINSKNIPAVTSIKKWLLYILIASSPSNKRISYPRYHSSNPRKGILTRKRPSNRAELIRIISHNSCHRVIPPRKRLY